MSIRCVTVYLIVLFPPVMFRFCMMVITYQYQTTSIVLFNRALHSSTTVVWKNTAQLGIARTKNKGKIFVVAKYHPPGNYKGQFTRNVFHVNDESRKLAFKNRIVTDD